MQVIAPVCILKGTCLYPFEQVFNAVQLSPRKGLRIIFIWSHIGVYKKPRRQWGIGESFRSLYVLKIAADYSKLRKHK